LPKRPTISKVAAGNILYTVIGAITKTVAKGETVTLIGFGSFGRFVRACRPHLPESPDRQRTGDCRHDGTQVQGRRWLQVRRGRQEGQEE